MSEEGRCEVEVSWWGSRSHLWRRLGKKLAMSLDIDLIKTPRDAEIARDVRKHKKPR
jgi:hypothetical protein